MTAQITVSTADGRSFSRPVDRDEFAMGRDSRNHLVLGDRQVSKFHCQIVKGDEEYAVKDLNSSNGTLINGIRVDGEVTLSTGDRIRVGPYELIFAEGDEGLPGYLRPKSSSPVPQAFDPSGTPEDMDVSDLLDPVGGAADEDDGAEGAPFGQAMPITDPVVQGPASSPGVDQVAGGVVGGAVGGDSGLAPREGHAYLEIVDGDGKGHMITVGSRGVSIGAGSRNNLVLDDPFVSRLHARVDVEGGRYVVKDTGSTNGIRVDGQDVAQAELANGTRLQVGGVLMLFRRPGEAAPGPVGVPAPAALPPSGHPTQALTPGPPSRSGRTAQTMRELSALPPGTGVSATLRPEPQAPAKPPPAPKAAAGPKGVITLGSLQFRYWQLGILGVCGGILVLALLWQAAGYMFHFGSGNVRRDMEPVFQAGLTAYESGDWTTAEGYLTQLLDTDPQYAEAQQYMAGIALERENQQRSQDVGQFVDLYQNSQEHIDFARAYDVYQQIPATSRYYDEARAMVAPLVPIEAQRLMDQALLALELGDAEDAIELMDKAEAYDPDIQGLESLRAIADTHPRKRKKLLQEYRDNLGKELDPEALAAAEAERAKEKERDRDRDRDRGRDRDRDDRKKTTSSQKVGDQAIAAYTSGDVDGARTTLQRAIDTTGDAGQKLELQDVLGRIDRVERAFAAGSKAMKAGDLDAALDRYETAYKNITRMDSSGSNERRDDIRQELAECRYRRGRAAFDKGKYAKANFEWSSGRKAYSGHSGISQGRKELEEVAKGIYNEGYLAEREGTQRGIEDARKAYEQVMAVAPRGDGFAYYDKASGRLAEL